VSAHTITMPPGLDLLHDPIHYDNYRHDTGLLQLSHNDDTMKNKPLTQRVSDDETDSDMGYHSSATMQHCKRRPAAQDEHDDHKRPKWTQEIHRSFVESVYEIGVKQASPSIILENMTQSDTTMLTSERVKSHLQKYRKNRPKAKDDFMKPYDAWMQKALQTGNNQLASPEALLEMMTSNNAASGEMAAFLSYSVLMGDDATAAKHDNMAHDEASNVATDQLDSSPEAKSTDDYLSYLSAGVPLAFPEMTDEEKTSSIGTALLCVRDMFGLMGAQLEESRKAALPIVVQYCASEELKERSNQQQHQQPRVEESSSSSSNMYNYMNHPSTVPSYHQQQQRADAPAGAPTIWESSTSSSGGIVMHHHNYDNSSMMNPPQYAPQLHSFNYNNRGAPRNPTPGAPQYRPIQPQSTTSPQHQQHQQQDQYQQQFQQQQFQQQQQQYHHHPV
jgi:SHAQKYF class myb-like DNA-binding protein